MTTTTVSDPKGPALADEIEYSITITEDHRLLVNDAPVSTPAIREGDSEALLSWALGIVAQKHDEIGGALILTVRDKRDGGYAGGVARLPEGRNVLLADLRAREDRTYTPPAHHTLAPEPEVVTEPLASDPAPSTDALPDDIEETTPRVRRRDFRQTGPIATEGMTLEEPPQDTPEASSPAASPVPSSPTGTAQDEYQEPTAGDNHPVEMQTAPPLVEHPEHVAEMPVEVPSEPESAPVINTAPQPSAPLPAPTPNVAWEDQPVPRLPIPERSTSLVEEKPEPRQSNPIPYARNRPQAEEIEGKVVDPKRRRRNRIILGVVGAVVVGAIGAAWFANQGKTAYVAVCVDERTMARQATDTACDAETASSPYYRWWYTPEGSQVPAVGDFAQEDQGTVNAPSRKDATISYGYEEDGGVFEKK